MKATDFLGGSELVAPHNSSSGFEELLFLRLNQLLALCLLLVFSTAMLVILMLIWRVDGAPLFFGHYRVGRDGKLFKCLKFRSMRRDADAVFQKILSEDASARAEWDKDQKLLNDPRITPVGRFLRKTSLDELPQLFNVLKGEMSLVGPRPITLSELERYGNSRWHYVKVRPGMTGLWQLSGRNNTTYAERVGFDREYVETRSLAGDFIILVKTLRVVVQRDGAR